MDWLEQVALALRMTSNCGFDQNVFLYVMPANVLPCAMLSDSLQGLRIDQELPDYYKGPMQLVVRAKEASEARVFAEEAMLTMVIENGTLPGFQVNYIRPRHTPIVYPRSDGDNYEASVNFDVCFVRL